MENVEVISGQAVTDSVRPRLEEELESLHSQQREMVEQYEASVEELKASNEELQAMNEELRSATEELETGREELQSINEELITVNHELKGKVDEVDRTNSDLQNLMASNRSATVFLDRELRIKRYTPAAVELFNLIPTDIGRPLSDLSHLLRYDAMASDAAAVLDRFVRVEREISTRDNRWYIAQLAPYRTTDDRIAGLVLTFIDITTRKHDEESLRTASMELDKEVRKFDAVVSSVPDFIFTFDLEGRFTFINRPLLEFWQTTLERAMGKTFHDIDHTPPAASKLAGQIQQVVESRQPVRDEMAFSGPGGEGYYDYILVPILGADGGVEAVAGTTRDITKRKQAEGELRLVKDALAADLAVMTRLQELGTRLLASDEVRPLLLEVLDAVIELQNADFGTVQLCDRASDRLNVVASRGFGAEVTGYFDGLEDQHICRDSQVRRERLIIDDVEADPSYLPHRKWAMEVAGYRAMQLTPLFDRAGVFLGILSTYFRQPHRPSGRDLRLTDLYARQAAEIMGFKLAEEKIRSSQERYRLIFESAKDFTILTTDLAGVVTSWNPGAAINFGYTAAEIIGRPFSELFTPEDRAAGVVEEVLAVAKREGAVSCDRWHLRQDGTRFWGSGVVMAMAENGSPTGFLKILRDTTPERQALEDRLLVETERARLLLAEQHARQQAEAANQAKDRFLAILSHELRTPLAPIQMTLYTLGREKRLSAHARESLAIIRRSVEMEVRLIDDLLDVSRIVHGKLDIELAPMDLHACVRRAIEVCQDEVTAGGLQLVTRLEAAPAAVVGDATRLQQVFGICSTMRPSSRRLAARSRFAPAPRGGRTAKTASAWRWRIRASGSNRRSCRLCSRLLSKAARTWSGVSGGSGWGWRLPAAWSRRTAAASTRRVPAAARARSSRWNWRPCHQKASTVKPAGGSGANRLSVKRTAASGVVGASRKRGVRGLRLLVVEDHADMRNSLRVLFRMLGCTAHFSETLAAARAAVQAEPFDVLLSDINLPDGDGWDLLRELIASGHRPPTAIAMSGFGSDKDVIQSRAAGFEVHLVKPFSPEELHGILERAAAKLSISRRGALLKAPVRKRKVAILRARPAQPCASASS